MPVTDGFYHWMIEGLLTLAAGVFGWFGNQMWQADKRLLENLSSLREELPKTYLTKDDYRQGIQRLEDKLDQGFQRLLDKMDGKQDKRRTTD